MVADLFNVNNQIVRQSSELFETETFRKLFPRWVLDFISSDTY